MAQNYQKSPQKFETPENMNYSLFNPTTFETVTIQQAPQVNYQQQNMVYSQQTYQAPQVTYQQQNVVTTQQTYQAPQVTYQQQNVVTTQQTQLAPQVTYQQQNLRASQQVYQPPQQSVYQQNVFTSQYQSPQKQQTTYTTTASESKIIESHVIIYKTLAESYKEDYQPQQENETYQKVYIMPAMTFSNVNVSNLTASQRLIIDPNTLQKAVSSSTVVDLNQQTQTFTQNVTTIMYDKPRLVVGGVGGNYQRFEKALLINDEIVNKEFTNLVPHHHHEQVNIEVMDHGKIVRKVIQVEEEIEYEYQADIVTTVYDKQVVVEQQQQVVQGGQKIIEHRETVMDGYDSQTTWKEVVVNGQVTRVMEPPRMRPVQNNVEVNFIRGGQLKQGQNLQNEQSLWSLSGFYFVKCQGDGKCAVYQVKKSFQLDGCDCIWQSSDKQSNDGPFYLTMQADGNLVLYNLAKQPFWDSKRYNQSPVGPYTLEMQDDGNLVTYDGKRNPTWDRYQKN